jgi:hypothetical protein
VRDRKSPDGFRRVPLYPASHVLLTRYRSWRDENVPAGTSTKFVRTGSGSISAAYIWKLVKSMARRAGLRLIVDDSGAPELDHEGLQKTEVTPHTLRRTYGSDLANRDVETRVFSPVMGHSSTKVTDESYVHFTNEQRARKILLAGDGGPFSLSAGVQALEAELAHAKDLAKADPDRALAEIRRCEELAREMGENLRRVARGDGARARRAA